MGEDKVTAANLRPYSARAYAILHPIVYGSDVSRLHPLALHLWVHLTEPAQPGRGGPGAGEGERAADLLSALDIAESGHLEHMPGHLYLRIGRFADAVVANERAHAADALYLKTGLSPYGPCHNLYFVS